MTSQQANAANEEGIRWGLLLKSHLIRLPVRREISPKYGFLNYFGQKLC
jgi:hypothetical protein